eukprot:GHRQ01019435.1.p1 GENE.GHRQ01019435.1~~GHRQ01019435.1.p1  ORF type:complete len:285 (+),score=101.13 GHRQ01019435.1:382-1236(+)
MDLPDVARVLPVQLLERGHAGPGQELHLHRVPARRVPHVGAGGRCGSRRRPTCSLPVLSCGPLLRVSRKVRLPLPSLLHHCTLCCFAGTLCQAIWPFFNIYAVAASSVFSIPFWRHFIAWLGGVPATPGNFKKVLKKGSVAVIVGGIAEMYMQHKRKERIKLLERKGFVKIAVEAGVDGGIIPVYHFGNTQVFDFWPQSLAGFARKQRAGLGLLVGRWGTPLPRKVPLYMVSGVPIPVPKVDKADPKFDETVDAVHAQVVAQLQELYDRHKASYGWADRPLIIE